MIPGCPESSSRSRFRGFPGFPPAVVSLALGLLAFLLAASRINPGLLNSPLPPGPGLTPDESFNIQQGVYLVESLLQQGPLIYTPQVAEQVFAEPAYLPDHPPLGRLILGIAHESTSWLISGAENCPLNVAAARLGACAALATVVFVMSAWMMRNGGIVASISATLCLLLTPAFVGHARLATLETATALAWLGALIPLLCWWTGPAPPRHTHAVFSGMAWGLLMLTKMQGILFPPVVIVWAFYRFGWNAVRPLILFGTAGLVLFFVAWPWLWLAPIDHTLRYLGRAAKRPELYVWYFGQRYADKSVPWHFPFVMTAMSIPGFVLPGLVLRVLQRRFAACDLLLLLSILGPLVTFAVPGVPVYDGPRLLLCVFPPLFILAGRGFATAWEQFCGWLRRKTTAASGSLDGPAPLRNAVILAFALLLIARSVSSESVMSPFAISVYSDTTGGNPGARWLGMEASYWVEALNGTFWESVPEDSTVLVAPVSHQFQLQDMENLIPQVRQRGIRLTAFRYDPLQQKGLLLLLHRLADLRMSLRSVPEGARTVSEVSVQGTVLARLIDSSDATWTETP